jgi:hypothetical protein
LATHPNRLKKRGKAKFTAWTVTDTRVDYAGSTAEGAVILFGLIAGREQREKVLKDMQERHQRLNELGA